MQQKYLEAIRLKLRHIVNFQALEINLESGQVTELKGKNGSGKTTVLNLFKNSVSGKAFRVPSWLVSDFEESGTIETGVKDGLTVLREIQFGATDAETTVYDQFGKPVTKSPMGFIKDTLGDGNYINPVELANMDSTARTKALVAALDIDPAVAQTLLETMTGETWPIHERGEVFPTLLAAEESYKAKQTAANALKAQAEQDAAANLRFVPDAWKESRGQVEAPKEPKLLGDIFDRKAKADADNRERKSLTAQLAVQESDVRRLENDVAGMELKVQSAEQDTLNFQVEDTTELLWQIAELTKQLDEMKARNASRETKIKEAMNLRRTLEMQQRMLADEKGRLSTLQARVDALGAIEDVDALQAEIDAHSDKTEQWRQAVKEHGEISLRYAAFDRLSEEAKTREEEAAAVKATLREIRRLPLQLLEGVTLPIPGMQIMGDKIFLPQTDTRDGSVTLREFDAFGEGDRLRFATMLAMTLAPINVVMIDGAEVLDASNRLVLYRTIAEAGFIAMTTVADDSPFAVNQYTFNELTEGAN